MFKITKNGKQNEEKIKEEAYLRWLETDDDCDCPAITSKDDTEVTNFLANMIISIYKTTGLGLGKITEIFGRAKTSESVKTEVKTDGSQTGEFSMISLEIDNFIRKELEEETKKESDIFFQEITDLSNLDNVDKMVDDIQEYYNTLQEIHDNKYKLLVGINLYKQNKTDDYLINLKQLEEKYKLLEIEFYKKQPNTSYNRQVLRLVDFFYELIDLYLIEIKNPQSFDKFDVEIRNLKKEVENAKQEALSAIEKQQKTESAIEKIASETKNKEKEVQLSLSSKDKEIEEKEAELLSLKNKEAKNQELLSDKDKQIEELKQKEAELLSLKNKEAKNQELLSDKDKQIEELKQKEAELLSLKDKEAKRQELLSDKDKQIQELLSLKDKEANSQELLSEKDKQIQELLSLKDKEAKSQELLSEKDKQIEELKQKEAELLSLKDKEVKNQELLSDKDKQIQELLSLKDKEAKSQELLSDKDKQIEELKQKEAELLSLKDKEVKNQELLSDKDKQIQELLSLKDKEAKSQELLSDKDKQIEELKQKEAELLSLKDKEVSDKDKQIQELLSLKDKEGKSQELLFDKDKQIEELKQKEEELLSLKDKEANNQELLSDKDKQIEELKQKEAELLSLKEKEADNEELLSNKDKQIEELKQKEAELLSLKDKEAKNQKLLSEKDKQIQELLSLKDKEQQLLSQKQNEIEALKKKEEMHSLKEREIDDIKRKMKQVEEQLESKAKELMEEKKKPKKDELIITGLFNPEEIATGISNQSNFDQFITKYTKNDGGMINDGNSKSFIENYNKFCSLFDIFNTELMFQSMAILSRTKVTDSKVPIFKDISSIKEQNIKEVTDLVFYPLNSGNLELQKILKEEHTNKSVTFNEMVDRDTEIYRNIFQVENSDKQIFIYTIIKLIQNIMNFNDSKQQIFFKNKTIGDEFFQFIQECKKRYILLLKYYSFALKQKHNIKDHFRKLMSENKNIQTYIKVRQDTPNNNPRFDFATDNDYNYLLLKYTNNDKVYKTNERVGANEKKEYYFFGPYDGIFDSKITNVEIANKMKDDIVEKMITKKENVCLLATGQSGSGKTSILIYFKPTPEKHTDGIIVELLNLDVFQKTFVSINLSMTNIYLKQGLKKSSQNDIKIEDYLITPIKFKTMEKIEFKVENRKWKNGEDEIGHVMNELMKGAEEEPTSNNPDSSRSIKIFDITCKFEDGSEVKLFGCDLPGIENKFIISVNQIKEFLQSYINSKKYQTRDVWYDDYHCMNKIADKDKNLYDETFWKEFNENVDKYYNDTLFRNLYMNIDNTNPEKESQESPIELYRKFISKPKISEKLKKDMLAYKPIFEDILIKNTECANCFVCFYNKFDANTKICDKIKVFDSLSGQDYEQILEELEKKKEEKKKDVYLNFNILSLFSHMRQYLKKDSKNSLEGKDFTAYMKKDNKFYKYGKEDDKTPFNEASAKLYLQKANDHNSKMFHAIFTYLGKDVPQFTSFPSSELISSYLVKLKIWDINEEIGGNRYKMNKGEPNKENLALFTKYTESLKKAIDEYTEIICNIHTIRQIVFNMKIRILEGYMINRSLYDMKVDIKELLMSASILKDEEIKKQLQTVSLGSDEEAKLKLKLNGNSLGFDRDIFTYCRNTDLNSDIYTNFYKQNKTDLNINGIILKEITKSLKSPHLLNFVVFNVINTTETKNNPPRPPYINISHIIKELHYEHNGNKVKRQVGKLSKYLFDLLTTLQSYNFYAKNEIFNEMAKNINDVKDRITTDMSYDTLYSIYLQPLLDYIKKTNALTLIGSLESTDSIQNITYDKYVCSYSEENKQKKICADEECTSVIEISNLPDEEKEIDKYFQKIKTPNNNKE